MHPTQHSAVSAFPAHPPAEAAAHAVAADVAPELGACAPYLIGIRDLEAFCINELTSADVSGLSGREMLDLTRHLEDVFATLRVLALFRDKRRIDAAAAHAHEMQSGDRDA